MSQPFASGTRQSYPLFLISVLLFALSLCPLSLHAQDKPTIKQIKNGNVEYQIEGDTLRIQPSDGSIIEYQNFDVPDGFTVDFDQPSTSARVLNRDLSGNQSQINGNLFANGEVYLTNPAGIGIGPGAQIDVGRLVAAAGTISDQDFLDGVDRFQDLEGAIVNKGSIKGSGVHLLGERIANYGTINAPQGTVTMSSGEQVYIGNVTELGSVKIEKPGSGKKEGEAIRNDGKVQAQGGDVNLSAGDLYSTAVDNSGMISAKFGEGKGGEVEVNAGENEVHNYGTISSSGAEGGKIDIEAGYLNLAYESSLDASGAHEGGAVNVEADSIYHESLIDATGLKGAGGQVFLDADSYTATSAGKIDTTGDQGGRIQVVGDNRIVSSGEYLSVGKDGSGGTIGLGGDGSLGLLSATLDASGQEGGTVRVGGEYQGGKDLQENILPNTHETTVSSGTELLADATGRAGEGGDVVVWSEERTGFYGEASARPGTQKGSGGFIEMSSSNELRVLEPENLSTGRGGRAGEVLLDPKNIEISDSPDGINLAKILTDTTDLSNGPGLTLSEGDHFGSSMSFNKSGEIFVVGATRDDTSGTDHGAAYVFQLNSDDLTNAPSLEKKITNGTNLADGTLSLSNGDTFGTSSALNATGGILAIGADNQDAGGVKRGAAYLFDLDVDNLSGTPTLSKKITDGTSLSGGGTLSLSDNDVFGESAAINGEGDILAIGADSDNTGGLSRGAVYVFSLDPENLSDAPDLKKKIADGTELEGVGSLSLKDIEVFGTSAALNGSGDLLAVGAPNADERGSNPHGSVYLFSLDPKDLSGTPDLQKQLTDGTALSGGDTLSISEKDSLGSSVALDQNGDLLAIGEPRDDTGGVDRGASYLFRLDTQNLSDTPTLEKKIADGTKVTSRAELSLSDSDFFGSSVALNGTGDIMSFGAGQYEVGGSDFGASFLFRRESTNDPQLASFSASPGDNWQLSTSKIVSILDGNDLTLQANNDITVNSAIDTRNNSLKGDLSLHAGRSVSINENVLLNGDLSVEANHPGALSTYRSDGSAEIRLSESVVADNVDLEGAEVVLDSAAVSARNGELKAINDVPNIRLSGSAGSENQLVASGPSTNTPLLHIGGITSEGKNIDLDLTSTSGVTVDGTIDIGSGDLYGELDLNDDEAAKGLIGDGDVGIRNTGSKNLTGNSMNSPEDSWIIDDGSNEPNDNQKSEVGDDTASNHLDKIVQQNENPPEKDQKDKQSTYLKNWFRANELLETSSPHEKIGTHENITIISNVESIKNAESILFLGTGSTTADALRKNSWVINPETGERYDIIIGVGKRSSFTGDLASRVIWEQLLWVDTDGLQNAFANTFDQNTSITPSQIGTLLTPIQVDGHSNGGLWAQAALQDKVFNTENLVEVNLMSPQTPTLYTDNPYDKLKRKVDLNIYSSSTDALQHFSNQENALTKEFKEYTTPYTDAILESEIGLLKHFKNPLETEFKSHYLPHYIVHRARENYRNYKQSGKGLDDKGFRNVYINFPGGRTEFVNTLD